MIIEEESNSPKDFLGTQHKSGPILHRNKDTAWTLSPLGFILLTFSAWSLEEWTKSIFLSSAHTAPWLLHTSFLVSWRSLGLVWGHAPWVIWRLPSCSHFSISLEVSKQHAIFLSLLSGPHASFSHLRLLDFIRMFPQIFHIWWSVLLSVFILLLLQTSMPFFINLNIFLSQELI